MLDLAPRSDRTLMAWEWTIDIESYLGPRRVERCLQIAEAAIECFAELGFAETSVGTITERARVQRTQFYFFFENKTDCFTACHRLCLAEVEARVRAAADESYRWQDKLRAGTKAALDLFSVSPHLARLILFEAELVGTEADKKIRQAAYDRLARDHYADFRMYGLGTKLKLIDRPRSWP